MKEKSLALDRPYPFSAKIQDYIQLTKLRLAGLVVFSAVMGYVVATGASFSWTALLLLSLGGFLVTASSNAFNQLYEKETDKLMDRTSDRPLPAGRMNPSEAMLAAGIMGLAGVFILWKSFNPLCGILSFFSLLLYTIIYTPSKRVTTFSVLIGAIPGAFPPLLGWVAATNQIGLEGVVLFAFQFIWQFPHFWAIAWVLHDDYSKAGFKMLPANGRTRNSAFQTLVYSVCLLPLAFVPNLFGFISLTASILIFLTGIFFAARAVKLFSDCGMKSAHRLMLASFIYLPVVQVIWMVDKFL